MQIRRPRDASRSGLPVGNHVEREEGLIWRRRVDWDAADYLFYVASQYRKLARATMRLPAAVDGERRGHFRGQEYAAGGRSKTTPAANLFPMMPADEVEELAEDAKANLGWQSRSRRSKAKSSTAGTG